LFNNYFTITLRNLLKHRFYALISIFGLALGLGCFAVLFLLILHETNYDTFHQHSDRIVRLTEVIKRDGIGEHSASVPFPVASALEKEFPKYIEKSVRLFNFQAPFILLSNPESGKKYNEKKLFFADKTFLEIFDFPLQSGDSKTALSRPNSVIITPKIARKYFKNEDVIGKKIKLWNDIELEVTGVFEPLPLHSHISFDFICSFPTIYKGLTRHNKNWVWNPCWTYFLLTDNGANFQAEFEQKLPDFVKTYFPEALRDLVRLELQELERIHLYSNLDYELQANGDADYVWIFKIMSVFVLIIAIINFINLATVRSSLRAQEIIVRRAIGASRQDLMAQFLVESLLVSLLAVLPAFIMVELALPFLSDLSGNPLRKGIIEPIEVSCILTLTAFITGLLSGIYPAIHLSHFQASTVFKGAFPIGQNNQFIRRFLVVLQFVISVFLLISTSVINRQLLFLQDARLGFDKEQVLILPVNWARDILYNYDSFKSDLLDSKAITSVTAMETILGRASQTHEYRTKKEKEFTFIPSIIVREDFIKTFNIKLLAGNSFTEAHLDLTWEADLNQSYCPKSDPLRGAVIVNEAYVRFKGWTPQEAIGKRLGTGHSQEKIVGVVENFHFLSLHHEITPFLFNCTLDRRKFMTKYVVIKINENQTTEAIQQVRQVWSSYTKALPEYFFLKDNLVELYTKEQRLSEISGGFALISVLVASMGLFGLTSFITEQRRREVGIRKALGACNKSLVILLSQEFLVLVSVGTIAAIPLAWWILQSWLDSFSYAVELNIRPFILAGFITTHVTILTVILHVARMVRQTPISEINQ